MAMDGDGGTLKWKSFLEIILGRRFHVFTAWQGGGNESLVLVFYECGVDRSSRCSMCGFDKVMKTRLLKRPVRFYCHDESDLNISGTCNSESFTSKVEMILISGFLCDFYVTCNKCGNVTNHKWFAIPKPIDLDPEIAQIVHGNFSELLE